MSMFSEIANEAAIEGIARDLKKKYDAEHKSQGRKDALREAILTCFNHFEWSTPDWAKRMESELNGHVPCSCCAGLKLGWPIDKHCPQCKGFGVPPK